ncbi:MAG TPA: endonuclease [Geminicoccaceae bacterium]|nr:endonuclease [Geminicoccus sp.]HMU51966.1 endonuclease [Geminicoccaceae bacterium]
MQRRAKFIMGGVTVLAILALGRYGMIDMQRSSPGADGMAAEAPSANSAVLLAAAADSDTLAVRDWLREQVTGQTVFQPAAGVGLLAELDEDPRDQSRVRLIPTGRSVSKAAAGESAGWSVGRVWPVARGLGGERSAAYLDLHNIRAAEPDIDRRRNGRDYSEGVEASSLEPDDSVKGDMARALFYMSLRYDGRDGGDPLRLVVRPAEPGEAAMGGLCILLDWNDRDPVDSGEARRNDRVERYQGNRNPFIDRPEFARVLWGRACPGRAPGS